MIRNRGASSIPLCVSRRSSTSMRSGVHERRNFKAVTLSDATIIWEYAWCASISPSRVARAGLSATRRRSFKVGGSSDILSISAWQSYATRQNAGCDVSLTTHSCYPSCEQQTLLTGKRSSLFCLYVRDSYHSPPDLHVPFMNSCICFPCHHAFSCYTIPSHSVIGAHNPVTIMLTRAHRVAGQGARNRRGNSTRSTVHAWSIPVERRVIPLESISAAS